MMKFILATISGILIIFPWTAAAQSLEAYLEDRLHMGVRVEVVKPYDAHIREQGIFGRLRSFLGVRSPVRIRPAEGTKFIVQSSAYAPSPYQTNSQPCITAAGTRVRPGVVASNFLPMGTLLEIDGEEYIVEDRMNPRYNGYYIDLWFPSTSSALQFGRRNIEITVIGYGEPGQPIREPEEDEAEEPAVSEEQDEDIEQVDAEEEEGGLTIWGIIRERLAFLGSLLGARQAADVDRFDVDCFGDES